MKENREVVKRGNLGQNSIVIRRRRCDGCIWGRKCRRRWRWWWERWAAAWTATRMERYDSFSYCHISSFTALFTIFFFYSHRYLICHYMWLAHGRCKCTGYAESAPISWWSNKFMSTKENNWKEARIPITSLLHVLFPKGKFIDDNRLRKHKQSL